MLLVPGGQDGQLLLGLAFFFYKSPSLGESQAYITSPMGFPPSGCTDSLWAMVHPRSRRTGSEQTCPATHSVTERWEQYCAIGGGCQARRRALVPSLGVRWHRVARVPLQPPSRELQHVPEGVGGSLLN